MRTIGKDGLKNIAMFMCQSLSEDKNDFYWRNRISLFIVKFWPTDKSFTSLEVTEHISLILIRLRDEFPNALEAVLRLQMLVPLTSQPMLNFIDEFYDTSLPEEYPEETFSLLSTVFMNACPLSLPTKEKLESIIERLLKAAPKINLSLELNPIKECLLK